MLFRFARSRTEKSRLVITKSTPICSATYLPSSLVPPSRSVKSSTATFFLPCSLTEAASFSERPESSLSMSSARREAIPIIKHKKSSRKFFSFILSVGFGEAVQGHFIVLGDLFDETFFG